jgi:hypothetical protein
LLWTYAKGLPKPPQTPARTDADTLKMRAAALLAQRR